MKLFVKDKWFYKSFFTMALTISLQNVIVYAVNLADNVMIGGYSELSLSAVAVVNQIQFMLQMIALGTSNGLTVLTSQYWGVKKMQPIRRVFAVALTIAVTLALAIFAAVFFAPTQVLSLLTDQAAVVEEAVHYAKIVCFSYVPFVVSQLMLALMRSVEKVRIGFGVSVAALCTNVVLNYGLIYGKLGLPEMGIRGAATATLVSRLVELMVVALYVFVAEKNVRLKISDLFKLEKSYFRDYIKVGFPLVLSAGSWGIAMTVQGAILGHLGSETVLSANSIASTVFQVMSVVAYAGGSASGVIIGKTVGEKRIDDVKKYTKTLQVLFLIISVVSSALLFACKGLFISFFKVEPATAEMANTFINILCVTLIGTGYEAPVLGGIVSAGGETDFVFKNDLIFMWGIVLPASLLSAFVFHFSPAVTFACLKADQVLKCAVAAVKVNRYKWIKNVTR